MLKTLKYFFSSHQPVVRLLSLCTGIPFTSLKIGVANHSNVRASGLWEEAKIAGENPHTGAQDKQHNTSHREALGWN